MKKKANRLDAIKMIISSKEVGTAYLCNVGKWIP